MSHWNHRLVRRTYVGAKEPEISLEIHEAYYDDAGKVWAVTQEGVTVHGETVEEVRGTLERMLRCLNAPILDYESIPEPGAVAPSDEPVLGPEDELAL